MNFHSGIASNDTYRTLRLNLGTSMKTGNHNINRNKMTSTETERAVSDFQTWLLQSHIDYPKHHIGPV